MNADNSVAYGEYLTGARCLEMGSQANLTLEVLETWSSGFFIIFISPSVFVLSPFFGCFAEVSSLLHTGKRYGGSAQKRDFIFGSETDLEVETT